MNWRICDWDPCWTVATDKPVHVGVPTTEDKPCVGVAVGVTTSTTQAAVIGLMDARQVLANLQRAIDECERATHLAGKRDKARNDALEYLRTPGDIADTSARDAAIVRAFGAGATFDEIAGAAGLDTDVARGLWHAHLTSDQRSEGTR